MKLNTSFWLPLNLQQDLHRASGVADKWPVACEDFLRWVVEVCMHIFCVAKPLREIEGALFHSFDGSRSYDVLLEYLSSVGCCTPVGLPYAAVMRAASLVSALILMCLTGSIPEWSTPMGVCARRRVCLCGRCATILGLALESLRGCPAEFIRRSFGHG